MLQKKPLPPVELVRGEGWTIKEWEEWNELFAMVGREATAGLAWLGITYTDKKVGRVHRVPKYPGGSAGKAAEAGEFEMYALQSHLGTKPSDERVEEWQGTAIHEGVHVARMERYSITTFAESVATEGLAYYGEDRRAEKFNTFVRARFERAALVSKLPGWVDFRAFCDHTQISKSSEDWYFSPSKLMPDISQGELYGVQRVHYQHSKNGLNIGELIDLPPKEVLALT